MQPKPDRILDLSEFPVLYVDDELENLRIFDLTFRRNFTIVTASSAEAALEIINDSPVALVLSDQRMAGMSGTDFLAKVAAIDPKTIRILVTAYGDSRTLESAINSGSIYKFVPKPWNAEELQMTIRRGIEAYALDRERDQLVRELSLLNRVSKTISQELNLGALMEVLVETITRDFGFDAAAIMIFNPKTNALEWRQFSSDSESTNRFLRELPFSEDNAPTFLSCLSRGEAITLSSEELWELERPVREWITEIAADETAVVPLIGRFRLEGLISVDNRRGGKEFSAEDLTLLEGLANQAVTAIENARLVEDLRRSRQQVMRSDRLGTLGTLAAGLAHEINNPLVSIRTFLSMAPAKRGENDPEFWEEYHSIAFDEVERIQRLVETMQQLGRDVSARECPQRFEIRDLIGQALRLVQRKAAARNIEISVDTGNGNLKIVGIRDQIHQLMLNLILNAVHAAPESGHVWIRARRMDSPRTLVLEVEDNGSGVSEEILDQIFDPFFTTKSPDEGTGLGLMICHRIVAEQGGVIEVEEGVFGGALFRALIPAGENLEFDEEG